MNDGTSFYQRGGALKMRIAGVLAAGAVVLLAIGSAGCGERDDRSSAGERPRGDSAAGAPAPGSYQVVTVANGGAITGRVRLRPGARLPEGFQSPTTQSVCASVEKNNRIEPGPDGGVPWAIVYLEGVKSGRDYLPATTGQSLVLDQQQCQYLPHLVAVPVGRDLPIRNNDPVPHNVRIEDPGTDSILLNIVQASAGRVDNFTVPAAGPLLVKCDYHPWMNAYLFGVDNPYFAVSGADGSFSIDGIPPGNYTVKLWFNGPRIRAKRQQSGGIVGYGFSDPIVDAKPVTIAAGGKQELEFEIEP